MSYPNRYAQWMKGCAEFDMNDIHDFATNFSGRSDYARIVVDDQNARYRREVISLVAADSSVTNRELLRCLIDQECLLSRTGDIDNSAICTLLSRLLELGGCEDVDILLRAVLNNQDLDGDLISGRLVLSNNRKAELLRLLDGYVTTERTSGRIAMAAVKS